MKKIKTKKRSFKRISLSLGTISLVIAPVASVISCGTLSKNSLNVLLNSGNFKEYTSYDKKTKTLSVKEGVVVIASDVVKKLKPSKFPILHLKLPNSLLVIEQSAFERFKIETIDFGNKLKAIGQDAFKHAKLEQISLPSSLTKISGNAFFDSELSNQKALNLPEKLTSIGDQAFKNAKLTQLKLGDQITYIGNGAFGSAKLTQLNLPEKLASIGDGAFFNSQLAKLVFTGQTARFKDKDHGIGDQAFSKTPISRVEGIPQSETTTWRKFLTDNFPKAFKQ